MDLCSSQDSEGSVVDVGVGVDSSGEYFFEGAEKLLEIWFGCSDCGSSSSADLRKISRSALQSILQLVRCEVISFKRSDSMDAYVLSESSLFVSRDRLILKTCGSTSLLRCLDPLIYLAKEVAGFDEILDVFYSRKNFLRPDLQADPHTSFAIETELLDSYFDEGAAYCLGRMNSDHWFLYTLAPAVPVERVRSTSDQTLEVLMQGLDADRMKIFTREYCDTGKQATQMSGIDQLIPGMAMDDFLFDPCGYSMNGLTKTGGYYMTIHVTPEPDFSYVSFETNYPAACLPDLVARVVRTFQPSSFMVTLLAAPAGRSGGASAGAAAASTAAAVPQLKAKDFHQIDAFGAFKMKEMQSSQVNDYLLTFVSFVKVPS